MALMLKIGTEAVPRFSLVRKRKGPTFQPTIRFKCAGSHGTVQ